MIDAVGTTAFTYTDSGQLLTENGPFANSTVTSIYWSRMRTNLSLAQPTVTQAPGYVPPSPVGTVGTVRAKTREPSLTKSPALANSQPARNRASRKEKPSQVRSSGFRETVCFEE